MMIQLYLTNPANLLTSIDARKALKGDACSIIRVHEFLDAFNIINHSVTHADLARTSTTAIYVPFTAYADGASEEVEKLIKSRENEDQSIQGRHSVLDII